MPTQQGHELGQIPDLRVEDAVPLSRYTRFGIGGPARVYAETSDEGTFISALTAVRESGANFVVIGGGTNLVVSDAGFDGVVLRFTASCIQYEGERVRVAAGAILQTLVDDTVEHSLEGLQTMTGIPGTVGAAVYGNAGAYGHSISEIVHSVRFFDGAGISECTNQQCEFEYRESIFKRHKHWIIFSTDLAMPRGEKEELQRAASDILKVRNEKYPPTMKCAGSIFKNLLKRDLSESVCRVVPEKVVREGKIPSAWFLEQVGAKGQKNGDIHVADYHANLIYNVGNGTAGQLRGLIDELKKRVLDRFGLLLEEEVQYVGFPQDGVPTA